MPDYIYILTIHKKTVLNIIRKKSVVLNNVSKK